MVFRSRSLLQLVILLALAAAMASCQGCSGSQGDASGTVPQAAANTPTARLYILSTLAGALEPCGCSKDQLGGLDHLAAFVESESKTAPNHLLVSAGPLLFIDAEPNQQHEAQDQFKASTIAESMKGLRLQAWAPGYNDWAFGADNLKKQAVRTGATLLGVGAAKAGGVRTSVKVVGGIKVGLFGISDPKSPMGSYPKALASLTHPPAIDEAKAAVAELTKQGAQMIVAVVALPRGEALRIADAVTGIHLIAVGRPHYSGHGNTAAVPAELIGDTLVVETANHGQTISIVDVFATNPGKGPLKLSDGGGVKRAAEINEASMRARQLEARINGWKTGGTVDQKDLDARVAELAALRLRIKELDVAPPPPKGNFFRYRAQEIREELGESAAVTEAMVAYYKKVNAHNKTAFKDLKPEPAPKGEASYVGIDTCTDCHSSQREVWDKTAHAHAYKTLVDDFKEFNLECVGCHVTGYGKPGGSTVTHNDKLQNVQCEDCHGPGSQHIDEPENPQWIQLKPDPKSCVDRCHHSPHVEGFDATAKMELILGPGHGK